MDNTNKRKSHATQILLNSEFSICSECLHRRKPPSRKQSDLDLDLLILQIKVFPLPPNLDLSCLFCAALTASNDKNMKTPSSFMYTMRFSLCIPHCDPVAFWGLCLLWKSQCGKSGTEFVFCCCFVLLSHWVVAPSCAFPILGPHRNNQESTQPPLSPFFFIYPLKASFLASQEITLSCLLQSQWTKR